jgi:hypothetical protein
MQHPYPHVLLLAVIAATSACSPSALSPQEALEAIRTNAAILKTDKIAVVGVSHAPPATEAIAKTDVNGSIMNLKLRRYDKGWQWEFAETKGGTWIEPSLALAPMREEVRLARAKAWAEPQLSKYSETAEALEAMRDACTPFANESLDLFSFVKRRGQLAALYGRFSKNKPEHLARFKRLYRDDPVLDAWGRAVAWEFKSDERRAVFRSSGADGEPSADDVGLLLTPRPEWDSYREATLYRYTRHWLVPEGLETAVKEHLDKEVGDLVETVKVIR